MINTSTFATVPIMFRYPKNLVEFIVRHPSMISRNRKVRYRCQVSGV